MVRWTLESTLNEFLSTISISQLSMMMVIEMEIVGPDPLQTPNSNVLFGISFGSAKAAEK